VDPKNHGDHNPPWWTRRGFYILLMNPSRFLSSKEERQCAAYFDHTGDLGYTLLSTLGVYTRFPFTGTNRSSATDLALADPYFFISLSAGGTLLPPPLRGLTMPPS